MNYLLCAHRLVHGGQDTGGGLRPLVAKSRRPSALAALPFRRHRMIGSAFPLRLSGIDGRRKPSMVTGANFRANWVALGWDGSDKFGKGRDFGAGYAEARTQEFIE